MAKNTSPQQTCCPGSWISQNPLIALLIATILIVGGAFLFTQQKTTSPDVKSPTESSFISSGTTSPMATQQPTDEQVPEITEPTAVGTKTIVSSGDSVTVDYVGKFAKDGKVFDTSIESVAKEAGMYQTGRDYSEGLTFTVGAGQMIKGFDNGVVGMKKGETKIINIKAIDGYGERDPKNVQAVPLSQLPPKPNSGTYIIGDTLQSMMGPVNIVGFSGTDALIDTNHFLAGEDLIFEVTIKEIK